MSIRNPDLNSSWKPSNKLFKNPHKGFTTFQRFKGDALNDNWTAKTGWKMEQIPEQNGLYRGDGLNYPDTTIAYFRVPWRKLEPRENEYNLAFLDEIMETATARGQKVMFRFPPHAARPGELELPQWFLDKLGLKEREVGDKRSPLHPLYFEAYAKLIRKIAEHIDGNNRVTAIDMSLVSAWGEQDQIAQVEEKDWKHLVDAYMQGFKITPISAQFKHTESIEYANTYRPVGLRADCLGDMNWHMFALYPKAFAKLDEFWKKAPIAFEVCWVVEHWLNMDWDIDYIIEQSLKWHITSFNAKSAPIPPELKDKCENWIKRMGYRFSILNVEYPSKAQRGDSLNITVTLENSGVAPIYHRYPLVFRLRGEAGCFDFVSDADITDWLPGDIVINETITLPNDIPCGEYVLEAGIGSDEDRVWIATDSPVTNGFNQISGNITVSD